MLRYGVNFREAEYDDILSHILDVIVFDVPVSAGALNPVHASSVVPQFGLTPDILLQAHERAQYVEPRNWNPV